MFKFLYKFRKELQSNNEIKFFSALRDRNFRLLLIGAVISHVGDELEMVAVSWLVLETTGSAFYLGIASILRGLPRLFFGVLGGVVADRTNRRHLLIICQATTMCLSFFYAFLVLKGAIQIWQILILLPVFGLFSSVFHITRQAFFLDLVGKENLMNALSLHSAGMNIGRIAGPSVAGIIIGVWGVGWCFFINGVSFIAILIALFIIDSPPNVKKQRAGDSFLHDLSETFSHLKQNRSLLLIIVAPLSYIVFGLRSHIILPIFARQILNAGASGYGLLLSSIAAGAVLGGLMLAGLGDLKAKGFWFLTTLFSYAIILIIFSFSPWLSFSCFLLFLAGILQMFFRTINQTLVQLLSPDELRAKILGVFMLDRGMRPLGALLTGTGASLLGAPLTLALSAGICGFIALTLFTKAPRIKEL